MKTSPTKTHLDLSAETGSSNPRSLPSNSLESQPETGAYFHLSCEEPICEAILDGIASIVADEHPSLT